jgi:hypothetical protein
VPQFLRALTSNLWGRQFYSGLRWIGTLFFGALLPILAALFINAVMFILAGTSASAHDLAGREILKVVDRLDVMAELRNVGVTENIFVFYYSARCDCSGAVDLDIYAGKRGSIDIGLWANERSGIKRLISVSPGKRVIDYADLSRGPHPTDSQPGNKLQMAGRRIPDIGENIRYLPFSIRVCRGLVAAKSHAIGDDQSTTADDLGISSYPTLITASNGCGDASEGGYKSKYFGPVGLIFIGLTAFSLGYWRGGRGQWGIALWAPFILFGIVSTVIGGIWILTGHAPLSFPNAPIHSENASVFCGSFAPPHPLIAAPKCPHRSHSTFLASVESMTPERKIVD